MGDVARTLRVQFPNALLLPKIDLHACWWLALNRGRNGQILLIDDIGFHALDAPLFRQFPARSEHLFIKTILPLLQREHFLECGEG